MGDFQRAGEEAHGRSRWVMREAISTLGSRVTAELATRAKMHDGTSAEPSPSPDVIMKSMRMSLNVRQTRGH